MHPGYFHRVIAETPTRLWINNPSEADARRAIAAGATGCTTNPAYCSKLLESEPTYLHEAIDRALIESHDDDEVAGLVYAEATLRIAKLFLPMYEKSGGRLGFVTMQGDPRIDDDHRAITEEALRFRHVGPNYMAKVPVTAAGMQAIEALLELEVPVCATEVFSLAQAVPACELYERVTAKTGKRPALFVTHITGILDQYWEGIVRSEQIDIPQEILAQAGCIVARSQYRMFKERGYQAVMLGGGARGLHHFTEMVGGDLCVTLNWGTVASLIEKDPSVVSRINVDPSPGELEVLISKLPGFDRALRQDLMSVPDFKDFGPLVLFRTMFLNGYARLLDEIANHRVRRRGASAR